MQGDIDAQREIAVRYAEGHGIEQDPVLAHAWLLIANGEHSSAEQRFVEHYLPHIDEKNLESGRSLAQSWHVHEDIRRR